MALIQRPDNRRQIQILRQFQEGIKNLVGQNPHFAASIRTNVIKTWNRNAQLPLLLHPTTACILVFIIFYQSVSCHVKSRWLYCVVHMIIKTECIFHSKLLCIHKSRKATFISLIRHIIFCKSLNKSIFALLSNMNHIKSFGKKNLSPVI